MEKAKMINTDNFEGNIKTQRSNPWSNWIGGIDPISEKESNFSLFEVTEDDVLKDITIEDELEMWRQIEKNYLESSQK